jgi:hypothetical protein
MAQKVVTELIDDVDGSEADETVIFAWKGYTYEIDLSSKNIGKLDKALAPFVDKARRLGRTGKAAPKAASVRAASNAAEVRAWAQANGYEVPERGRIPNDIRDAYDDANA